MKKIYSAPKSAIEKKVLRASILAGSSLNLGPNFGGETTGTKVGEGSIPEGEDAGSRTRSTTLD